MKLDGKHEDKIKTEALLLLEQGKQGWDAPHTLAAVDWMRKLIAKEGGNEKILVTAMYLHDIGYANKRGAGLKDIMSNTKLDHEEIGAREAEKIIRKIGGFSPEEIKQIVHLVRFHDHLDSIDSHDRQLVMEADSLAAINWERIKPTFNREDTIKYLQHFKETRPGKFRTETGKNLLKKLLKKAEEYLEKWK